MLNGVSVARRKRVNPARVTTSRMRASPAWAPKHRPTSCDREHGVHSKVEKEQYTGPTGFRLSLQLIIGKRLHDHPCAIWVQRLAHMRGGPNVPGDREMLQALAAPDAASRLITVSMVLSLSGL